MFRTQLVAIDRLTAAHAAVAGELNRLGDAPTVAAFAAGDATIEVAVRADDAACLPDRSRR
jgi:hypothetical protein